MENRDIHQILIEMKYPHSEQKKKVIQVIVQMAQAVGQMIYKFLIFKLDSSVFNCWSLKPMKRI